MPAAPAAPSQVAAARKLLELREAEKLRRGAFVSALWGLSVIGGPWFFDEEVESLLQVRGRCVFAPFLFKRQRLAWAASNHTHGPPNRAA